MKKNLHLVILTAAIGALCISGVAGVMYPDGSPGAKTGSPMDGATCAQCHTSNVSEVSWISSNIPENGWEPGKTYTLTLTATPESAKLIGFEVTAESDNQKVGTFIITDSNRTRFTNQNHAVTHSHDGTTPTDGKNSWQIDWKAPDTELQSISFYAAFNAANGDASTQGDQIYASSISYDRNQTTDVALTNKVSFKVYPNPAKDVVYVQAPRGLVSAKIVGLNGEQITSLSTSGSEKIRIETNNIKRGFYLLRAQTNEGEFTQRILLK